MKIFESISEYQLWRKTLPVDLTVGFVPTMGALHEGHTQLLELSRQEMDLTVLSIFVNPTQFNQMDDFEKYPQTLESDLKLAESRGVDAVFLPRKEEIYPDGYNYQVVERRDSKILCGKFRPGHFEGMLTIVLKLFQITQPHQAFFGEKDYQQYHLIKEMVSALFLPLVITPVATVRESSGLALSSRNLRLSIEGRARAGSIYKLLTTVSQIEDIEKKLIEEGFQVEYVEDHFDRRFVAAWLEGIRLIDNIPLTQTPGFSRSVGEIL